MVKYRCNTTLRPIRTDAQDVLQCRHLCNVRNYALVWTETLTNAECNASRRKSWAELILVSTCVANSLRHHRLQNVSVWIGLKSRRPQWWRVKDKRDRTKVSYPLLANLIVILVVKYYRCNITSVHTVKSRALKRPMHTRIGLQDTVISNPTPL